VCIWGFCSSRKLLDGSFGHLLVACPRYHAENFPVMNLPGFLSRRLSYLLMPSLSSCLQDIPILAHIESQNHLGWKRPLRSSDRTISPSRPCLLNHVTLHHLLSWGTAPEHIMVGNSTFFLAPQSTTFTPWSRIAVN